MYVVFETPIRRKSIPWLWKEVLHMAGITVCNFPSLLPAVFFTSPKCLLLLQVIITNISMHRKAAHLEGILYIEGHMRGKHNRTTTGTY
jgi:hypothetical protein